MNIPNGETFTVECIKVGKDADTPYSTWQEINEEGVITEITFRYPGATGAEDQVGERITFTMHLDEDGNAIDSTQEGIIQL